MFLGTNSCLVNTKTAVVMTLLRWMKRDEPGGLVHFVQYILVILVDFDEGQWVGTNLHNAILLGSIFVIIKVSLVTIPYLPHLA